MLRARLIAAEGDGDARAEDEMKNTNPIGRAVAAMVALPAVAAEQDASPRQPMSLIVPHPPGSNTDLTGRTPARASISAT